MIKRGGQVDKARTYYEQALKIDPGNEYDATTRRGLKL